MEIIPAILPKDFAELEDKVEQVKGVAPLVQVDICDGKFVPSFTWPYKKHDQNFEAILREDRGMPSWEDIDYEIDLMIDLNDIDAEKRIMDWITAGAKRVIIHVESTRQLATLIKQVSGLVELGLAINIDTPIDVLDEYIGRVQFIQCMGIAKIGFQGQTFDPRVLEKIGAIRKKYGATYAGLKISVDGGVSLDNAALLKAASADRLVAGSAIFDSGNVVQAIEELKNI